MNVARGKGTGGRSASFKDTVSYVMHDKDGRGSERVGVVEMLNMAGKDPKRAWREMQTTVEAASAIKARNGVKASGRKSEKSVYHYALSWHPDDKPTKAHMMAKAKETLKLLGLSGHQVLIVEHTDRPHKHIHIVVNRVHPETGRTASLAHDGYKLDRWAHEYEVGQNTIHSFNRAAKHERIMEQKKDVAKDGFEKAGLAREKFGPPKPAPARGGLSGIHDAAVKKAELKQRLLEKRTGLSAKHAAANARRQAEKAEVLKEFKDRKDQIYEKYQPVIDRIWKPKTPALELAPPGLWKRHEWMHLAKAMLQQRMADRRWPIHQAFTRALSRMAASTHEPVVNLAQKFRKIDERKDVMLPMRHTEAARKFAEPRIEARSGTRKERTAQVKLAQDIEVVMATADYEVKKRGIDKVHFKEAAQERVEKIKHNAEVKRAWADYRKEHGLPQRESKWNQDREANKKEFNRAAADLPNQQEKAKAAEPEKVVQPVAEQIEQTPEPVKAPTAAELDIAASAPDISPCQQERIAELLRQWEHGVQQERDGIER